jgi:hypothetical protein
VNGGREEGVRGEGGHGQGKHLVACTIVAGCTSTASTAAGSRDEHVGTNLLLTPAMSANILIFVKVIHISCCGMYFITLNKLAMYNLRFICCEYQVS